MAQGPDQKPAPPGRYIDGIIGNVAGRIILYSDLAGRLEQARQGGETITDSLACNELEDLLYQQLLLEQARIDSVVPDETQIGAELDRRISYFEQQIGGREKLEKFYGKSVTEISHVAWALNPYQIIEAGGGDHLTKTRDDAAAKSACIRVRPIDRRKDRVAIVHPSYARIGIP